MKNFKRKTLKKKGGNSHVYIKKPSGMEGEILYPIIKNIFPNKIIEFVENKEKYDLVIKCEKDNVDGPYIYVNGESFNLLGENFDYYSKNDPNCVANIFVSQHKFFKDFNNYFYLPFFLNVGPKIINKNPFIREFTNNKRDRLIAYIQRNKKEHREKMFDILKDLSEVEAKFK